jgi:hypothetical protein
MTRPAFFRILLSLLLLLTQQMAATHAMSHWSARAGVAEASQSHGRESDSESSLSRAFALDQTCDQCLAFAQLAGPLGHTPRAFVPVELVSGAAIASLDQPSCARTVCVFRSRAPPQA